MSKKFLQFFLITSFVLAQFFTEQVHELTHFLSQTNCDPVYAAHAQHKDTKTIETAEQHQHCKFLQLVSGQQHAPFLNETDETVVISLNFESAISFKIHSWISYSPSQYHQARAPPAV